MPFPSPVGARGGVHGALPPGRVAELPGRAAEFPGPAAELSRGAAELPRPEALLPRPEDEADPGCSAPSTATSERAGPSARRAEPTPGCRARLRHLLSSLQARGRHSLDGLRAGVRGSGEFVRGSRASRDGPGDPLNPITLRLYAKSLEIPGFPPSNRSGSAAGQTHAVRSALGDRRSHRVSAPLRGASVLARRVFCS